MQPVNFTCSFAPLSASKSLNDVMFNPILFFKKKRFKSDIFFSFQLDNYFLSFIFKGNIFSVKPFESSTILCMCYIVKQYV
jgi:hypothetical protein